VVRQSGSASGTFLQSLFNLIRHRGTLVMLMGLVLGIAASTLLALARAPASGPTLLAFDAVMALLFGDWVSLARKGQRAKTR
jgi:hypothetical protein